MATKLSKIINHWVPENSKVIDFGCGDGSLLKELIETKNILGYGVEINSAAIEVAQKKGCKIFNTSKDLGLGFESTNTSPHLVMSASLRPILKSIPNGLAISSLKYSPTDLPSILLMISAASD